MKSNYDWDSIRVRLANGESSHQISKSLGGKPTRQGIMKHAKKQNWMIGNADIPDFVNNLPLLQIGDKQLSKRTPETVNAILGFIGHGATDEMAARAAGIDRSTLHKWKTQCSEFRSLLEVARANKQVEWVKKIDQAKDWKAPLKLLQTSPETREQFADKRKDEAPTIILNIHRDAVVPIVVNRSEVINPVLEPKAEEIPELIEFEKEPEPVNWQGVTLEGKLKAQHEALEQRVMNSEKQKA